MPRQFKIEKAVRRSVPLLIGLSGPSGGGKTYTALRLATGIQKIFPGEIIGIDTESNRMLHYASLFDFQHIPFSEPFGSGDYLEVLKFVESRKPSVIIVDSMSHEHEGLGGLLDLHETELDRMAGTDYAKRQRMGMLAWQKPKAERRKLINGLLQMNSNFIFCFRAKESSRPGKDSTGKNIIENFGFMPIAGTEFVFEMTINCLLLPHANGVPSWQSDHKGESMMMKLPEQFKELFPKPGIQLDEDIGQQLAIWAKGDNKPAKKSAVKCPELRKLEGYLAAGKVQDIEIELKGNKENLLVKTKGAIKYLNSLSGEFTANTKGYSGIQDIINIIETSQPEPEELAPTIEEEPEELDVSREKDQESIKPIDDGLEIF